ncbi:hypothetical protein KC334_g1863 [Hortaea werneckii]|nr:hypothetical protein KC334_g1863 [Hortaea werneckii]
MKIPYPSPLPPPTSSLGTKTVLSPSPPTLGNLSHNSSLFSCKHHEDISQLLTWFIFLLQPDEVPQPTLADTFLFRGPRYLYDISAGRYLNKQMPEQIAYEAALEQEQQAEQEGGGGGRDETEANLRSAIPLNHEGESRKRRARNQARGM